MTVDLTPLVCPAAPFEFTFENEKMTAEDVKERVYAEILHYHPEARGTATANIQVSLDFGCSRSADG